SNLDNFGARYYASTSGRFMSPDWALKPVSVPYASFGDPQTLNLYTYVQNSPLNRIDADGHGDENHHDDHNADASGRRPPGDCPNGPAGMECAPQPPDPGKPRETKPAISVTVEGGFGLEGKVKVGSMELKAGAAVKGEIEASSHGTKVSAKGEI